MLQRACKIVGCSRRRCYCLPMVIVSGPEARIASPEGILKRAVQHGRADVKEGLHGRPVPAHLLRLTWGVFLSRVRSLAHRDISCSGIQVTSKVEPLSVLAFPNQDNLTFGRHRQQPHHNPAYGG
jgi:hypothetical protein